jgi:hypothetical protein
MDLDVFLGLTFLVLWLTGEAFCVWLLLRDDRPRVCYGTSVGVGGSARPNTPTEPNFYGDR